MFPASHGPDDLYAAFLADVTTGAIHPGERLGEQSLAARWKVGRVPVRETLLRLEQDGLVERIPNSGTYVRQLDEREVLELYDIRIGIEPMIAAAAARHVTKEQAKHLLALAKSADLLEGDGLERAVRDRAFHGEVCLVSQCRQAARIVNLARLHLRCSSIYQRVMVLGDYTVSQPDHRPIAAAIAAGDARRAALVMRQHLHAARQAIIKDMGRMQRQLAETRSAAERSAREFSRRLRRTKP